MDRLFGWFALSPDDVEDGNLPPATSNGSWPPLGGPPELMRVNRQPDGNPFGEVNGRSPKLGLVDGTAVPDRCCLAKPRSTVRAISGMRMGDPWSIGPRCQCSSSGFGQAGTVLPIPTVRRPTSWMLSLRDCPYDASKRQRARVPTLICPSWIVPSSRCLTKPIAVRWRAQRIRSNTGLMKPQGLPASVVADVGRNQSRQQPATCALCNRVRPVPFC